MEHLKAVDIRKFKVIYKGATTMNRNVPEQYTIEFGEKVAKSFVFLGTFVDKTEFRLEHLERHLGEALAEVEKQKEAIAILSKKALRPAKKFPLKTVAVLYVGMVVGRKLNSRANRDKLKQAFQNGAEKAREMGVEKTVDKVEEVVYGEKPTDTRITPEHDVLR